MTLESGDKENRDPITGLPLSLLLANSKPGSKAKGSIAIAPGQKYIATTITTTVLSPVPAAASVPVKKGLSLKAGANAGAGAGKRVALGAVKKTNAASEEVPYSLADADTDDEEPVKKVKSVKAARPRRSLRLAATPVDASAPVSASTETAPASTSTTTTVKATKKSSKPDAGTTKTKTKRARTSDAADSELAAPAEIKPKPKSSSSTRAKREALVKHTAAVVAALDMDAGDGMDVDVDGGESPAKKRRTSPRKSVSASGNATLSGGVRAVEVFSPLRVSPRTSANISPSTSANSNLSTIAASTNATDDAMDVDDNTADCIQRIIDARCRDLTVMPLANVSDAYSVSGAGSVSTSVATSRAGSVFGAE